MLPDATGKQVCRVERLQSLSTGDKITSGHLASGMECRLRCFDCPVLLHLQQVHRGADGRGNPRTASNNGRYPMQVSQAATVLDESSNALLDSLASLSPPIMEVDCGKPNRSCQCELYDGVAGLPYGNTESGILRRMLAACIGPPQLLMGAFTEYQRSASALLLISFQLRPQEPAPILDTFSAPRRRMGRWNRS